VDPRAALDTEVVKGEIIERYITCEVERSSFLVTQESINY